MSNNTETKVLIFIPVYNEETKIGKVLESIMEQNFSYKYEILVIDDCSNDNTSEIISKYKVNLIRNSERRGIGYGFKRAIDYGLKNNFTHFIVCAGNGKMQPSEFHLLLEPIIKDDYDYIQGSRYLTQGQYENLPFFRHIMIKIFTGIVSLFTGFKGTDVTCGFRAYKLSLFNDTKININQEWLNKYELEYYLHYYVIKLGYKLKEVPISMIYPKNKKNYSKIKPFIGWWSMIRPWVYLYLGIKK